MKICIIPARGGSRRIPRKNTRDFRGRPMLAHAIEKAQRSELFNRVFVSTDDDEIATIARSYEAETHYRRPEMAEDKVGTQAVMKGVLEDLYNAGVTADVACCLYPCVPLLDTKDLVSACEYMISFNAAYCFSVGTHPILHDAGQFYFGATDAFLDGHPLIAPTSIMYPIPPERDCDVNTMDDWYEAERKYDALRGLYVH